MVHVCSTTKYSSSKPRSKERSVYALCSASSACLWFFSLQEQLLEKEQRILELERKLEEKERELHAIRLDNEASWAKEDLLREQNKELQKFIRERDNSETERAQHIKQIQDFQEHIQDKERQFMELQEQAEKVFTQDLYFKKTVKYVGEPMSHLESIASSAVRAAIKVKAYVIICFMSSGRAARLIAKCRPTMPVLSVMIPRLKTNQLKWSFTGAFEARQSLVVRGLFPMLADPRHPREEWRQRPLPVDMVQYARVDAHYLLYIAGCLVSELKQLSSASIISRYLNGKGNSHSIDFDTKFQDIVTRLCAWRDLMARIHDESLRYVLSEQEICVLASEPPITETDIHDTISTADDLNSDSVTYSSFLQSPSPVICSHFEDFKLLFQDNTSQIHTMYSSILQKHLGPNGTCPLSKYNYALLSNVVSLTLAKKPVSTQNGFRSRRQVARKTSRELFV